MATQGTAYEQQKQETVAGTFCLDRVEIYKCTIMLNDHFDYSSYPSFKMYQCSRAAVATHQRTSPGSCQTRPSPRDCAQS
jgi:hypothetical protein